MYLVSLGAGILAGLLYGLIGVRSPAPPAIALIGLLGMLLGEQAVPVAKRLIDGTPPASVSPSVKDDAKDESRHG
jgi:XapX domain-containing protein